MLMPVSNTPMITPSPLVPGKLPVEAPFQMVLAPIQAGPCSTCSMVSRFDLRHTGQLGHDLGGLGLDGAP